MKYFKKEFPYPSQRMPVMARNVVSASQPSAVEAGINALRKGGNAVDAALATAITLTVVEPTGNGIGSDAFAIVWDGKKVHGLNGSGRSPAALTPGHFEGMENVPAEGWLPVTVPGAVSAWVALSEKFGKLPFYSLFESAIHYAEEGYMVGYGTSFHWQREAERLGHLPTFAPFMPGGRSPEAGELFRYPDQARTLEAIAQSRGEAFYRGDIARTIAAAADEAGAPLALSDLENHQCDWVEPVSGHYNGLDIHEIPPNGQGLGALIMLGILDRTSFRDYPMDSADAIHVQVEAMKLAFADLFEHVSDPAHMQIDPEVLLDPDYLSARAATIDMQQAAAPRPGIPRPGGTVYLATADASGMMVSYIQSNFDEFGSGIVVPGTGISLHNRGRGFTLEPGHPNQVGGGKRPFHTLIPAFATRNGEPLMSFGVMGGHMQCQGHAQLVTRVFDYGMNPQAANDAPRWQLTPENTLFLEPGITPDVQQALADRGHVIETWFDEKRFNMGGAQLVLKTPEGYIAGTESRKDGLAAGF